MTWSKVLWEFKSKFIEVLFVLQLNWKCRHFNRLRKAEIQLAIHNNISLSLYKKHNTQTIQQTIPLNNFYIKKHHLLKILNGSFFHKYFSIQFQRSMCSCKLVCLDFSVKNISRIAVSNAEAAGILLGCPRKNHKLFLYSLTAISAVKNLGHKNWRSINTILDLLTTQRDKIKVFWILGHVGIQGNNHSDAAA